MVVNRLMASASTPGGLGPADDAQDLVLLAVDLDGLGRERNRRDPAVRIGDVAPRPRDRDEVLALEGRGDGVDADGGQRRELVLVEHRIVPGAALELLVEARHDARRL
jgi:hypothetical protein